MSDVPDRAASSWLANFCNALDSYKERVTIERVSWELRFAYYYVVRGECFVGEWPGVESEEWIEYIPENAVVERDGDLYWRYYSPVDDTMHYVQMTKGGDARRP